MNLRLFLKGIDKVRSFHTTVKHWQFIKYIIVGVINMIVGATVYYSAVTFFDFTYWISNFFAISSGGICGYILASKFVFSHDSQSLFFGAGKYFIVIAAQYTFGTILIGLFIFLGTSSIAGYFLSIPLVVVLSFLLQKSWVFKKEPDI